MALEKARIQNLTRGGQPFEVLFNPELYSVNRGNNFSQVVVPGLSTPLLQFSHGELKTLQMDLFFDSRERHLSGNVERTPANEDVRKLVDPFLALMDIDPQTHAPPILLFQWGSLKFQCVLATANQKFTMFREDGCPVRATVQVTFQEYMTAEQEAEQVRRQTADYTKIHEVVEGESLAGIAYDTYGDAALWRPIALRNGLDDPRRLQPGQKLFVPRLPYRAPGGDVVFS
jgi:hypothetical protein